MNTASLNDKSSRATRFSAAFRTLATALLCAGFLALAVSARGAELKQDTLKSWDAYVQAANARLNSGQGDPFLVNEGPEEQRRLRDGEILVSSAVHQNPKPIPSGLIHDWIGTAFLPNVTTDGVFSAVRDYADYKDFYKPTVTDSKLIATDRDCDTYSLRVVNKEAVAHTALDMENQTCYFRVDAHHWYSVTHTTQVREIRHYGTAGEMELPPDHGSGYVWRLYSIARFEQVDGGVFVQVEAIALSRNIPLALRGFIDPIVRRVSRNSLFLSLQQTEQAVHSTVAANSGIRPAIATQDGSPVPADPKH